MSLERRQGLRSGKGFKAPAIASLIALSLALQGCKKWTSHSYETLILPLDGKSELQISTYPSDIARSVSGVPFLWKEVRSPDSVYFQVFVRQVGRSGPNPYVESITIHAFSYEFPGQAPVPLISDYDQNFWMQDSPEYNPRGGAPVPVNEAWYLDLEIDLTLNGKRYRFKERVNGKKDERLRPLLTEAFR